MSDDAGDYRLYDELVAEMDRLRALPSLTREQAELWASLSGTRLALYLEHDTAWQFKAIQNTVDGTWHLIAMPGNLRHREAEADA